MHKGFIPHDRPRAIGLPGFGGELHRADFQRFLVNPDVYLSLDMAFGAAVFARVPLAFALDAGAVDQQAQRTLRPAIGNVDLQVFCRRLRVLKSESPSKIILSFGRVFAASGEPMPSAGTRGRFG